MNKFTLLSLISLLAGCAGTPPPITPSPNELAAPAPAPVIEEPETSTVVDLSEGYLFGHYPSKETSAAVYDELDYVNGVHAWLRHIPTASLYAMFHGLEKDLGIDAPNKVAIWEGRMDAESLFLTPNADSMYMIHFVDTKRDGPTVIEAPSGILGALDDHFFRHVGDIGVTGADKGKGGKYLVLPPGFEGKVPTGYTVLRPKTYRCWWFGRGQLVDGSPKAPAERFKKDLKMYSLADAKNPPAMVFVNASKKAMNTLHNNDFGLLEEVAQTIEFEHPDALSAEERGLLASIGIQKGIPFQPSKERRAALQRASKTAFAITRAVTWDNQDERIWIYPDRKWKTAFIGGNHEFLRKDGSRDFNARTLFHYYATGITPAMVLKMVGKGSQYLWTNLDAQGTYLDGAKNYRLHYPKDIPAGAFWSLVVYDPETRSMLKTEQEFPTAGTYTNPIANKDGSHDIYFGPKLPAGVNKGNWIQTVPGKGWHTIARFYSPTEQFFEQSWKPGDIEEVK